MNNESVKCKISFKGIENFLRRIAFNLGNSPSQTEVKIISCIPIDVTDLQEKITCLEKQLREINGPPTAVGYCQAVGSALCCNSTSYHAQMQNLPLYENPTSPPTCTACPEDINSGLHDFDEASSQILITEPLKGHHRSNLDNYINQIMNTNKRSVFKTTPKKKRTPRKTSPTQLVYYAQTTHTPFNYKSLSGKIKSTMRPNYNKEKKEISNNTSTFFEDVMRNQYRPRPILDDFSDASCSSSPVCRDVEAHPPMQSLPPSTRELDACSCVKGRFQNVDNVQHDSYYTVPTYICDEAPYKLPPYAGHDSLYTVPTFVRDEGDDNKSVYYDSSFYDMVPVKEKPNKIKKNKEVSKIKHKRHKSNFGYYPDTTRGNTACPIILNYHAIVPPTFKPLPPLRGARNDKYNPPRRRRAAYTRPTDLYIPLKNETSRSYVDCGKVYPKPIEKNIPIIDEVNKVNCRHPIDDKVYPSYKNAECLTVSVLDTECQTTTTGSVRAQDSNTEQTLNQIKSILQSVLTEVKTNTLLKHATEETEKKDAMVQKGLSQGNMPEYPNSLNHFPCNPYTMNPYANSCSRRGSSFYPTVPYSKYVHNFPVFIQTPGRNVCTSYYNNPHGPHSQQEYNIRQAMPTTTNTDRIRPPTETDKLIKEIYKSIALNVEVPTKETPNHRIESKTPKPASKEEVKSEETDKQSSSTETAQSIPRAIFLKDTAMNSSATPFSVKTLSSNVESKSMQSQMTNTTGTVHKGVRTRQHLYSNPRRKIILKEKYDKSNDTTDAADDTETVTEDSDSVDSQDAIQEYVKKKKGKQSIFTKMFRSVRLLKHRNKKKILEVYEESEEESEANGDSDEYETIYNEKIDRNMRIPSQEHEFIQSKRDHYTPLSRHSPRHSKTTHVSQKTGRYTECTKPYLEQEYRRIWNENLTFNNNRPRNSTATYETQQPRYNTNYETQQPRYNTNYETRAAVVPTSTRTLNKKPAKIVKDSARFRITKGAVPKFEVLPKGNGARGLSWFKKHKLMQCNRDQWKALVEG